MNYIAQNLYAKNTASAYKNDLKNFNAWMDLNGLSLEALRLNDLINFFREQSTTKKLSTLKRVRVALNKVKQCRALMNEEAFKLFFKALSRDNAFIVDSSKPLLKDDFINKINSIACPFYKFLFFFQYKGAFRISEVLALRVEDVEVVEGEGLKIKLNKTKTGNYTVGLAGGDIVKAFNEYVARFNLKAGDKLFSITRGAVHGFIKRNLGADFSSHSFRSGHITTAINAGVHFLDIQKTSRHKSINTIANHYYNQATLFKNSSAII